jgi:hypothetical protein
MKTFEKNTWMKKAAYRVADHNYWVIKMSEVFFNFEATNS